MSSHAESREIIDVETVEAPDTGHLVLDYRSSPPVNTAPDEVRTESATGGLKGVKPAAFDLVPPRPLDHLARFYGRSVVDLSSPASWSAVFNYINQQLWGFWRGDDTDPQTGLLRTVSAVAGCLAIADAVFSGDTASLDDRPVRTPERREYIPLRDRDRSERSDVPRFDMIPVESLFALSKQYRAGADKYGAHNWTLGFEWSKVFASSQRHLWQFWNGEDYDAESGQLHVLATAWHALALTEFAYSHPDFDDRPGSARAGKGSGNTPKRRWWGRGAAAPGLVDPAAGPADR